MSSLIENAAERLERRVAPTSPIRKDVNVSFEFFPPATPKGLTSLENSAQELGSLSLIHI